jgi:hypothetical protein
VPDSLDENNQKLKPLASRRPTDVPEVIDVLRAIATTAAETEAGKGDGIACFSRLYTTITEDVVKEWKAGELFRCGQFILELDLTFAQRYLDALDAWLHGRETPACWRILFERRLDDRAEWRFAVVGVNAHVNFDLAFALLDVWEDHPDDPLSAEDEQRDDYQAINTIFRNNMDQLCEDNGAPWTRWGKLLRDGGIVDRIANRGGDMLVQRTREVAWDKAIELWPSHERDGYRDEASRELDEDAGDIADLVI